MTRKAKMSRTPEKLTLAESAPRAAAPRIMQITEGALEKNERGSIDVPRRSMMRPQLPPGVIPTEAVMRRAAKTMGVDEVKLAIDDGQNVSVWGWLNSGGVGCGNYFPGYPYLAELSQRSEYRAPSETLAGEMTRKWVEFKTVGEADVKADQTNKLNEIADAFKHFKIKELFRKGALLDSFFGAGRLYIRLRGQERLRDKPLVIDAPSIPKNSLLGFTMIEPMWCTPTAFNSTDPSKPDFYKPPMWLVLGKPTHSSRLLPFVSREVPDLLKAAYNFGGISLTQLMIPYVNQWFRTRDDVSKLVHNFSTVVLKTNMTGVLGGDNGASAVRRAQLFNQYRDNQGTMLVDKDTEDMMILNVPLGSLDKLQAQAQEHMAAPAHIPLVKLFGITPGGLNASADPEIQVFYDFILACQELLFTDNLTTVLQIIQLTLYGSIDPAITATYVTLTEPDGTALAQQRKSDADAGVAYIDRGVILPSEERERIKNDPLSGYNNLTGDGPPDPEPGDEDPDDEQGSGGDDGGAEAK